MNSSNSFAHSHVAGHVIGGGRYSLHVPLGETDLVWLAQDEVDQRLAVIRFFPQEVRQDPRASECLRARMQQLAGFSHPGVARVMEWYEAESVEAFVASEYIEGAPIDALKNDGRVSWARLRPIAEQVAAALAALHQAGIVHHGIEPDNIISAADGAKLLNPIATGILRNPLFVPAILAQPLALRFYSREQLRGADPKAADDIFSLGATLYELLTGQPVFAGAKHALASRSASGEKTVNALRAVGDVPSEIVTFIAGALSDEAGDRPGLDVLLAPAIPEIPRAEREPVETRAVAQEPVRSSVPVVVDAYRDAVLVRETPKPAQRRSRLPWLAAACLMICAAGASGAWYVTQARAEKERAAARAAAAMEAELLAKAQLAEAEKRDAELRAEQKRREEQERLAKAAAAAKAEKARLAAAAEAERKRIHSQFSATPAAVKVAGEPKASEPLPASNGDDGFVSLFNGRDLSEWNATSSYWSVSDGAITAQCTDTAPVRKRFYLVSKQEPVQDFELRFEYRMRVLRGNKQANGGLVYRATTNNSPELDSYQFDVTPDAKNVGAINEDKKRYRLAGYGENAVAMSNDKTTITGQLTDTNSINSVRPEDWNKCVIVAKGNQLTHYINGYVAANVVDEHARKQHKKGMIALELHTRNTNNPSSFIQFREIKLKRLTPSNLVSTK